MSNIADEFYEDDDDQQPATNSAENWRRKIEKENRELRKQVAEAEQIRREVNFIKAGIDLADPKFKYFVKGYDGDLTPEAIKQAAEEAQLIAPPAPIDETDKQAWQTTNRIAAGAGSSPEGPSWTKRIADANSEAELMAVFAEAQAQGIDLSEL